MITELTRRLQDQGVDSDIRLVDGAAMIFYGSRRMTQDIDASYSHTEEVEAVARQMAAEHNLPENWLNDSARAFIPDGAQWTDVPGGPATVLMATDETLLAMKLAAERHKDILDLSVLAGRLGITDPERIVDIAFDLYGEDSIPLSGERDDYLIVAAEALRLNIGEPSDDPAHPASRRREE
ncbi:DUF6036 family nucleotidyltransferase [Micrococcus terreus]|uniref:DUF6036 family nucleotidyltransferase n=1 Tax=Micrococcus terreus TaxID=574650 RepID=UPI003D73F6E2